MYQANIISLLQKRPIFLQLFSKDELLTLVGDGGIYKIMSLLSPTLQAELKDYNLCFEHYNRPWQKTHIDGPPPTKKSCYSCNNNKRINES